MEDFLFDASDLSLGINSLEDALLSADADEEKWEWEQAQGLSRGQTTQRRLSTGMTLALEHIHEAADKTLAEAMEQYTLQQEERFQSAHKLVVTHRAKIVALKQEMEDMRRQHQEDMLMQKHIHAAQAKVMKRGTFNEEVLQRKLERDRMRERIASLEKLRSDALQEADALREQASRLKMERAAARKSLIAVRQQLKVAVDASDRSRRGSIVAATNEWASELARELKQFDLDAKVINQFRRETDATAARVAAGLEKVFKARIELAKKHEAEINNDVASTRTLLAKEEEEERNHDGVQERSMTEAKYIGSAIAANVLKTSQVNTARAKATNTMRQQSMEEKEFEFDIETDKDSSGAATSGTVGPGQDSLMQKRVAAQVAQRAVKKTTSKVVESQSLGAAVAALAANVLKSTQAKTAKARVAGTKEGMVMEAAAVAEAGAEAKTVASSTLDRAVLRTAAATRPGAKNTVRATTLLRMGMMRDAHNASIGRNGMLREKVEAQRMKKRKKHSKTKKHPKGQKGHFELETESSKRRLLALQEKKNEEKKEASSGRRKVAARLRRFKEQHFPRRRATTVHSVSERLMQAHRGRMAENERAQTEYFRVEKASDSAVVSARRFMTNDTMTPEEAGWIGGPSMAGESRGAEFNAAFTESDRTLEPLLSAASSEADVADNDVSAPWDPVASQSSASAAEGHRHSHSHSQPSSASKARRALEAARAAHQAQADRHRTSQADLIAAHEAEIREREAKYAASLASARKGATDAWQRLEAQYNAEASAAREAADALQQRLKLERAQREESEQELERVKAANVRRARLWQQQSAAMLKAHETALQEHQHAESRDQASTVLADADAGPAGISRNGSERVEWEQEKALLVAKLKAAEKEIGRYKQGANSRAGGKPTELEVLNKKLRQELKNERLQLRKERAQKERAVAQALSATAMIAGRGGAAALGASKKRVIEVERELRRVRSEAAHTTRSLRRKLDAARRSAGQARDGEDQALVSQLQAANKEIERLVRRCELAEQAARGGSRGGDMVAKGFGLGLLPAPEEIIAVLRVTPGLDPPKEMRPRSPEPPLEEPPPLAAPPALVLSLSPSTNGMAAAAPAPATAPSTSPRPPPHSTLARSGSAPVSLSEPTLYRTSASSPVVASNNNLAVVSPALSGGSPGSQFSSSTPPPPPPPLPRPQRSADSPASTASSKPAVSATTAAAMAELSSLLPGSDFSLLVELEHERPTLDQGGQAQPGLSLEEGPRGMSPNSNSNHRLSGPILTRGARTMSAGFNLAVPRLGERDRSLSPAARLRAGPGSSSSSSSSSPRPKKPAARGDRGPLGRGRGAGRQTTAASQDTSKLSLGSFFRGPERDSSSSSGGGSAGGGGGNTAMAMNTSGADAVQDVIVQTASAPLNKAAMIRVEQAFFSIMYPGMANRGFAGLPKAHATVALTVRSLRISPMQRVGPSGISIEIAFQSWSGPGSGPMPADVARILVSAAGDEQDGRCVNVAWRDTRTRITTARDRDHGQLKLFFGSNGQARQWEEAINEAAAHVLGLPGPRPVMTGSLAKLLQDLGGGAGGRVEESNHGPMLLDALPPPPP